MAPGGMEDMTTEEEMMAHILQARLSLGDILFSEGRYDDAVGN